MKKKKIKLSMILCVLIIGFLISTSSLNTFNTKALVEGEYNQHRTDSFDRFTWKWNITEVVSTESTVSSWNPFLAIDSAGNKHVAWHDMTTILDHDIFYKRWDAATYAWTTAEVVSTESTETSDNPFLAVDTLGNVHITWEDKTDYAGAGGDWDIFYKYWNASSSSWTTTEVISSGSTGGHYSSSLAIDSSNNVHIAWFGISDYLGSGTDWDIFYRRWDAVSSTWTPIEVVSTESTEHSYYPSLAVDSASNVHIAWGDDTNHTGSGGDRDIFYKHWDTFTSSWTTTEVVSTESTTHSYRPSLAVDSTGSVHIAWYDYTDYAGSGTDADIFYKRWDVYSSSWITTEVVSTESTQPGFFPSIAVDSVRDVHIAWQDATDYTEIDGGWWDIFYKRWDTTAFAWTTTEVVSTVSTQHADLASLAVDSAGAVHIVWRDGTNYAGAGWLEDIFYRLLAGPPAAPELAFIVPNPTEIDTVNLDWNNIIGATTYYVYRSTSYIWSVEGLVPITTVSSSEFIDTVPSEGFYYYVVVAGNFAGNSSHSNCQYVEVKFPDLNAPELSTILPNPTDSSSVSLIWDTIDGATEYYVYRSDAYIWSVELLTPIATVGSTSYIDSLPSEGYYFYVIVATDGARNSIHSNCEYVEFKVAHVREFALVSGLILAAFTLVFVVTRIRKRNFKPN